MAIERMQRTLRRQRALMLLLVGLFFTASLPSVPARAQSLDCTKVVSVVPNQFPAWSDGSSGWEKAPYYSTIQLADIDGDGQAELLARGPGGMLVNHFDKTTGVWIAKNPGPPLSDKEGYNGAPYYATIQLADIDGQPGAELIVKASAGIETWAYDTTTPTHSWKRLASSGPFPDTDTRTNPPTDWTQPQYYTTIQLADIDGDGHAELLGRGVDGIQVYHWNTGTRTWDLLGASSGLFADPSWAFPEYYSTIQLADIDGQAGAELLGRSGAGMLAYHWNTGTKTWDPLGGGSGPFTDPAWASPQYYSTIQLADIDGQAGVELLGRSSAGMLAYHWNTGTQTWDLLGGGSGPFTDPAWASPKFYSTIQLADVNGDGHAELLGRGTEGLAAYQWSGSSWTQLATLSTMSDNNGWALPQSYLTIQAADIDGQAGAEIIGKATDGIGTWKYGEGAFASTLVPGFPVFTGDQLIAYQLISKVVFPKATNPDLRQEYTNKDFHDELGARTFVSTVQALKDKPQGGVGLTDWNAVVDQLATELVYVSDAYNWFSNMSDLLQKIVNQQATKGGMVKFVNSYLEIPADDNTDTTLSILSLVFQFVSGIATLAGVAVPEAGIASAVASLVSTAFTTGIATSGSPNIQAAVAQLQQQISDQQTLASEGNACLLTAFLQNGGLLNALAQPIEALNLQWGTTNNDAMAAATAKGYELEIWKALTPVKWTVDCNFGCPCGDAGDLPDSYPDQPTGDPLFYRPPMGSASAIAWIHLAPSGACGLLPSQPALDHLFYPPNANGTGPLGVSLQDVHCGLNGWSIPGSLSQWDCINGEVFGGAAERQARKQRLQQYLAARAQINALIGKVQADVKNKAVRDSLTEPLRQARSFLQEVHKVEGTSLTTLAELTLQGFILKERAYAGQEVPVDRAQDHIARAHEVRVLLIEAPPIELLGANLAHQKNP